MDDFELVEADNLTMLDVAKAIENQGQKSGWDSEDSQPSIFTIHSTGLPWAPIRADFAPEDTQRALRGLLERFESTGLVLMHMAEVMEGATMNLSRDKVQIAGVGFRAEAFYVVGDAAKEVAESGAPVESHPAHDEQRVVVLADSEGKFWEVVRCRSTEDEVFAVEVPFEQVGMAHIAMAKMLNAFLPEERSVAVPSIVRQEYRSSGEE